MCLRSSRRGDGMVGVVRGRVTRVFHSRIPVTRVSHSDFVTLEESIGGVREASRGSIFLAFLARSHE